MTQIYQDYKKQNIKRYVNKSFGFNFSSVILCVGQQQYDFTHKHSMGADCLKIKHRK